MNSLVLPICIFGALAALIQGVPENINCNFEQGVCYWQNTVDPTEWIWSNGITAGAAEKPPIDETLDNQIGHYVFAQLSGDNSVVPILLSPEVTTAGQYCFRFSLYSSSKDDAAVRVSLIQNGQEQFLKLAQADESDRWRRARVEIHPTGFFQIKLEGFLLNGATSGVVAIDEIRLESGQCHHHHWGNNK